MSRPSALDIQMAAEARHQRIRSAIVGGTSFIICMTVLLTVSWWTLSILGGASESGWGAWLRGWFLFMAALSIRPARDPWAVMAMLVILVVQYLMFAFVRWGMAPTEFMPLLWTIDLGWIVCKLNEEE